MSKVYWNIFKVIGIALLLFLASLVGRNRAQDSQEQLIEQYFKDSLYNLDRISSTKWIVKNRFTKNKNYIYVGEGLGYNGKLIVLVQSKLDKEIISVIPLVHFETPSFFKKLENKHYFNSFSGKNLKTFFDKDPINVTSGATISSKAVIQAIQNSYSIAENIPIQSSNFPVFGFLEFFVFILLVLGFLITKIKNNKLKKSLFWFSMILSIIILGFIFNQHITLSRISAIINGYFPSLTNELYFYILLFGSILIIILTRKNVYCNSVCPFGAAQEILAKTGNAKPFRPNYFKRLKLIQRLITLIALLISLTLDNPTIAQYEVFSAFFQLTANSIIFGVLFIVIVLSLFIKKPWCNFMCPIDSVFAYVKLSQKSVNELWKK